MYITYYYVSVCDEIIESAATVKNIGVTFDSVMSMEPQVNAVCKSAFYHLRNLSRIRKYISMQSTEILVHAFVTSKLDFCNSLLYGLTHQGKPLKNYRASKTLLLD